MLDDIMPFNARLLMILSCSCSVYFPIFGFFTSWAGSFVVKAAEKVVMNVLAGDHEEGPNTELVVPTYGPAVRRDMESGSTPDRIFRLRSH